MYAERFGVSDAAKERKVLAIGNVIDTQKDYPDTVVASAIWHMEPTIDAAIKAVLADTQTTDTQKATAIRQILGQG
jgi:basic membrane lipoprotein Med (substrate-binding protein (PBP1-ABC) superfamily)